MKWKSAEKGQSRETVCDQYAGTVEPRSYKGDSLFDSYENQDWTIRARFMLVQVLGPSYVRFNKMLYVP